MKLLIFTTAMMFMVGCKDVGMKIASVVPVVDSIAIKKEKQRLKYESFHDSIRIAWNINYEAYKDSSWIFISAAQNALIYRDTRGAEKMMKRSKKYQNLMTAEYMKTKRFDDSLNKYRP